MGMMKGAVLKGKSFNDNRAMQTHGPNIWWLRTSTLLLAALAAGSATFWALRWMAPPPARAGAEINVDSQAPANPQGIARLLGGGRTDLTATSSTVASQFKLLGVVASPSETGYALIAVGTLPAKPYRVGDAVDETLVLQSVTPRSASLAATRDGPVAQVLELPPLARP
jgi:general secretion pathway protein C